MATATGGASSTLLPFAFGTVSWYYYMLDFEKLKNNQILVYPFFKKEHVKTLQYFRLEIVPYFFKIEPDIVIQKS